MGIQETEALAELSLPPGFRFFPTDEELLVQYLCKKVAGHDFSLQLIREIDLYKFDPWILPSKAFFGEKEWYFFSPRDRKYPNGSRPNRVAVSGYWKATGTDKIISTQGRKVGIKKALVFYIGKAPKGTKTNWIMHEYRLSLTPRKNGTTRLDEWVLCRIYKKNSSGQKLICDDSHGGEIISKEQSQVSTSSSSSSQLDDVLESLPEIDGRCFSLPRMNSFKTFQDHHDNHKHLNILQTLNSGGFDWATLAALNSLPELTPQPGQQLNIDNNNLNNHNDIMFMPSTVPQSCHSGLLDEEVESGMRTQRINDNSGLMSNANAFTQNFPNSLDPFEPTGELGFFAVKGRN